MDYGDVECLSNVINEFLKGNERFLQRAEFAKKENLKFGIENMSMSTTVFIAPLYNKKRGRRG